MTPVPALTDLGVAEVFALPFMARALLTVVVLAIAGGVVGLFISFRELEFVSDGLVHAVFPGLVVGAAFGGAAGILPGAMVAAILAAVLFTAIDRRGGIGADAAIAVVLTGLFSLGVVLVSRQDGYVSQLQEMLFGRLLTVSGSELWQIVVVSGAAMLILVFTRRAQFYRAFDAAGAEASGMRLFSADLSLGVAAALLVVAGVQALGVLMVVALLTVPMAAARLLTRGFALLIPIAILLPLGAGVAGLWLSFEWSVGLGATVSPGATVVLVLVALYGIAALLRPLTSRQHASRPFTRRPVAARAGSPGPVNSPEEAA